MNLPFFILKILCKMANKVHKYPESAATSLAHPCLITSLVFHELCVNIIDENIFLVDVGFDLKEDLDRKDKERRARKNTGHKKFPTATKNVPKPETYTRQRKKNLEHPEASIKVTFPKPKGNKDK